MVALQIRDVPEAVRDVLADRARARGQSLQAYLLALVEDEARRGGNVDVLRRFDGRTDGSREPAIEIVVDLDAARADRERALGDDT